MTSHQPAIHFREHDGTIHWRCWECGAALPKGADIYGPSAAECPGQQVAAASSLSWKRAQLGYVVRESWRYWARVQPEPKPHWLVPYEDLPQAEQEADQKIGADLVIWALKTLIDWRKVELSEGELCRRFGLDRMSWRVIRDQLGMQQEPLPHEGGV